MRTPSGLRIFDQLEKALLARLLDARRGEKNLRGRGIGAVAACADELDGVLVAADVLEVGVDFGDAHAQRGLDLLEGAAEDGEEGLFDFGRGVPFGREGIETVVRTDW